MFGFWKIKFFVAKVLFDIALFADFIKYHPFRLLRARAAETTLDYMSGNMRNAAPFPTTKEHLMAGLKEAMDEGSILEFGVYKGGSIRFIARKLKHKTI